MILCGLFAALMAVGAFIRIPVPVLPVTLQYLFTMLAGMLLGGRLGMTAVLVYIGMGLMGLPVFTEGGGIAYVLRPSFGYLIGFAAGTYATGKIANQSDRPGYERLLGAGFIGLGIVYLFGMVHYYLISALYLGNPIGLWPLFLHCFLLMAPGDTALCIAGAALGKRLIPVVKKIRGA